MFNVSLHSVLPSEHAVYVKNTSADLPKDGYRQLRIMLRLILRRIPLGLLTVERVEVENELLLNTARFGPE
jgi:hypothetical protein